MDFLGRVNIFTEVAKCQSFSGAAKALGITSSAVSKQVQNLEYELQVKLFNRTTRKVSLTEEGDLFYKRARSALESLSEAREELNDLHSTPKGSLRVSLPLSLGLQYLKAPIAAFARDYPDVHMDVYFEDRKVNVAEEEVDIAFRIGVLKDTSLIAKKIVSIPIELFTSPLYLKDKPLIKTPDDLKEHNVFEYTRSPEAHSWKYIDDMGVEGAVALKSSFSCDNVEMMKEAALAGIGVFIAPRIFVKQELAQGQLVRVLEKYHTIPERNLYALFPPNQYISRRTRMFIDYIQQYCLDNLRPF
ncbi:MAG: hypothetical protein CMH26_08540 [Micavibrio sp.]|nr:hypothetical protein [Micavibrio sp.]|tara:strand:+ start:273 stop:1178 length:906 start_codon:yes stop_codon:yes gene_type:complete